MDSAARIQPDPSLSLTLLGTTAATIATFCSVFQLEKSSSRWRFRPKEFATNREARNNVMATQVFWQSFWYLMAFYVPFPILVSSHFIDLLPSNYHVLALMTLISPIQGFFNFLVYVRRSALSGKPRDETQHTHRSMGNKSRRFRSFMGPGTSTTSLSRFGAPASTNASVVFESSASSNPRMLIYNSNHSSVAIREATVTIDELPEDVSCSDGGDSGSEEKFYHDDGEETGDHRSGTEEDVDGQIELGIMDNPNCAPTADKFEGTESTGDGEAAAEAKTELVDKRPLDRADADVERSESFDERFDGYRSGS
mmetsp:Transcript_16233/g.44994  ORF Transcript_16233/g.44994 Transcript_16233/m.44994 type:complete len:311 (-) Transcript_16233:69-1001(-)